MLHRTLDDEKAYSQICRCLQVNIKVWQADCVIFLQYSRYNLSNFYCCYLPDTRSHGGWFATCLKIGPSYMNNDSSVSRTHCMAWGVLLNLLLPVWIRCQILRCWSNSLASKKSLVLLLSRIPILYDERRTSSRFFIPCWVFFTVKKAAKLAV